MWIRYADPTGLSQYPVFKVQAQRGDTLLFTRLAVNDCFKDLSDPSGTVRPPDTQNASEAYSEAFGRR